MKKHWMPYTLLFLILTGCASHYVKVKDDSAFIYLKNPEARLVYFLSSLDGYEIHEANKTNGNIWWVRVPNKKEFSYFYIVDGKAFLPDCAFREKDGFGSENCIYIPTM